MTKTARKLSRQEVARFIAIRKSIAARKAAQPANDNGSATATRTAVKSAYVDTTMTPAMLAACVEAAGFAG